MSTNDTMLHWIIKLTGRKLESPDYLSEEHQRFPDTGIGYSQFNEYMLALQAPRVSEGFFRFVFGSLAISDFGKFRRRIIQYRKMAMLRFGSFVHAFDVLSKRHLDEIEHEFKGFQRQGSAQFGNRHPPLVDIEHIAPEHTHMLGYLSGSDPSIDPAERAAWRKRGRRNHDAYLDFDHLDVYIATSMRERIDFWNVAQFATKIQQETTLKELKLRFFDPTQAYCQDRIDKGLVEGLMLKRAACTIYMVGESETLGKDSELAATLAQGKPVIAYVPSFPSYDGFRRDYVESVLNNLYPGEDKVQIGLKFLKIMWPNGAWEDASVRDWLNNAGAVDFERLVRLIFEKAKLLYDKKERDLKDSHPLGLQVHLRTGVANGVLVARSVRQCASLVRKVILNRLTFDIVERDGAEVLIEKETKSIYRVVTRDPHVTNSFWNFYSGLRA